MGSNATVHVIGTGTIGEPLIGLLSLLKDDLGIEEVTFHKRTPLLTDRPKIHSLMRKGAKLCVDEKSVKGFQGLGMEPAYESIEALRRATVVIDCTPSGIGTQNKTEFYDKFVSNTNGFLAQGSEFGFGKPYARGINDAALRKGEDQFVQIVSCNTHNLSILIDTLAIADGGPENLVAGNFVCMRRANDISQNSSYVPSPQVGTHKDPRFGTHHARDAYHLFQTLGHDLNLFCSAIKLNTQYMHAIYFNIQVKNKTSVDQLLRQIADNPRMAITHKNTANSVFSFGRDQGQYGRILNTAVVCAPTLAVRNDTEIHGYCFTPQDGNSLLSSIAGATWLLYPEEYEQRIQCLDDYFYDEI